MNARGHILAIEISNPSSSGGGVAGEGGGAGVAIGRLTDDAVADLLVEPVRASGFGARSSAAGPAAFGGHDDDLMPAIDRLFRRARADARQSLALVAVSAGPGGYTSLRVACAAGKMIAMAARSGSVPARCVAVPTALALLESVPRDAREAGIAIALASKGETAWVECFAAGVPAEPGALLNATDMARLAERGVNTLVADRFLPESMRTSALTAGMRIVKPVFDAAACARAGARLPSIAPAELVPIYPREPDAVTLWRSRKPAM